MVQNSDLLSDLDVMVIEPDLPQTVEDAARKADDHSSKGVPCYSPLFLLVLVAPHVQVDLGRKGHASLKERHQQEPDDVAIESHLVQVSQLVFD